jgi:antitoxin HicB
MSKRHLGSHFEDFLKKEGRLNASTAVALKRVIAWELERAIKTQHLTKNTVAKRMKTSRAQLDRLLDPDNPSVTLETITRAAAAVGREVRISLAA